MTPVAALDNETTSLERPSSPTPGEVWEVGLIERRESDLGVYQVEHRWLLPVTLEHADPESLTISGFHERHPQGDRYAGGAPEIITPLDVFVAEFTEATEGCHLLGNVVSFDEERIAAIFHAEGWVGRFPWHYHLIDIENFVAGWLAAGDENVDGPPFPDKARPPWNSKDLSLAVGVDPEQFDRHTALGDARWALAMWDAITGVTVP